MEPIVTGRLFFTFNPYAAARDWKGNSVFQAAGMGLLLHRRGVDSGGSFFASLVGSRFAKNAVDHFVRYLNDFELWRKGEWVITHPRGYGGAPNGGHGTNAVLMHGFGDMLGFKELVGVSHSETHDYQVATTGGASVPDPYYDPPSVFAHEWTRSVLYLPGMTDTVIVHDRAHITDVLRRDRYYSNDQALFDKAEAPKQWILHMPVRPRIDGSTISWSTPGGQQVQWSTLLPVSSVKNVYDETALRKAGDPTWKGAVHDSELKYHVKLWPSARNDWDTFLNVIQVGDAGKVAPLKGSDQVEGVHVSRAGASDVVALFNGQASPRLEPVTAYHPSHEPALRTARLRSAGYRVDWTSNAATTEVFLADLDPSQRWVVEVDGRIILPVIPGSPDLLRFVIEGGGAHALSVRAAGGAAPRAQGAPVPPPARQAVSRLLNRR